MEESSGSFRGTLPGSKKMGTYAWSFKEEPDRGKEGGLGKEDVIRGLSPDDPHDGVQTLTNYRFNLLDAEAMFAMARVMYEGEKKGYQPDGWRSIPSGHHLNHAIGHIFAHLAKSRKEDHLSHAMVRLMMAWATGKDNAHLRRERVYVCFPYAADPEGNTKKAIAWARRIGCIHEEWLLVVPHLVMQFKGPEDSNNRRGILDMCLELVRMCDRVVRPGNVPLTPGMTEELAVASKRGMPIDTMEVGPDEMPITQ